MGFASRHCDDDTDEPNDDGSRNIGQGTSKSINVLCDCGSTDIEWSNGEDSQNNEEHECPITSSLTEIGSWPFNIWIILFTEDACLHSKTAMHEADDW